MRLSLCLIARNEAERLPTCLAAAGPFVDEMVVVDTGSSDGTPEVAATLGARVGFHPWGEHFAEAKNHALELTTGDWVIALDADEILRCPATDTLRYLAATSAASRTDAYAIDLYNYLTSPASPAEAMLPTIRFFRHTPPIRFRGRIHEQLTVPEERVLRAMPEVQIHHYGYLPTAKNRKLTEGRNLHLLELSLAEEKEPAARRFALFNLAREYQQLQRLGDALAAYTQVLDDPGSPGDFFFPAALTFRLECLLSLGQNPEALEETGKILTLFPDAAEVWRWRGNLLDGLGDVPRTEQAYLEAIRQSRLPARRVTSDPRIQSLAWYDLGNLYISAGRLTLATQCLTQALLAKPSLEQALPRLREVFDLIPPDELTNWLPSLLRSQPGLRPLLEPDLGENSPPAGNEQ